MLKQYEYEYEELKLDDEQKELLQMNMIDSNALTPLVNEVINKRGQAGWEAMYPFSVPLIWFRREKNV